MSVFTRSRGVRTAICIVIGVLVSACRHAPAPTRTDVVANDASRSPRNAGPSDDLRTLVAAAPSGWQAMIRDTSESPDAGIGPVGHVEFTDHDRPCEIHYGAGGSNVRTEYGVVRLFVYRRADEASVHAVEARLRELSLHCPLDVELGRTPTHFIAIDVCGRAYMTDPRCAARTNELEASLRRTLGGPNDGGTR